MNRISTRFFAALLAVFCAFALVACGGHSRSNRDGSDSDSSDSSAANINPASPAFDPSGDWTTNMDNAELGVTSFSMSASGHLGGTLKTDSGENGAISGQLSGNEAEYTVTFHSRTFLASVTFISSHASASGSLVDADGHVHSLKLVR